MTLYERCIAELVKPEVIEMHKSELETLPGSTKLEILAALCKNGFFRDATMLRPLLTSTLVAIDFGECVVNDEMLQCLHVCTLLRRLDLRLRKKQERHITKRGLTSLFPHVTLLEVLDIPWCKEFNDEVTETLCQYCVNLKQLYIQHSSITNHSLQLIGHFLNSLCVLNILGTAVDEKGIELLIRGPLFRCLPNAQLDPDDPGITGDDLPYRFRDVRIFTSGVHSKGTLCFAFRGLLPTKKQSG